MSNQRDASLARMHALVGSALDMVGPIPAEWQPYLVAGFLAKGIDPKSAALVAMKRMCVESE